MEILTCCLSNFCLIYGILAFLDGNSRVDSGSPAVGLPKLQNGRCQIQFNGNVFMALGTTVKILLCSVETYLSCFMQPAGKIRFQILLKKMPEGTYK